MKNQIIKTQESETHLRMMAAANHLYSDVKKLLIIKTVFTVPIPLILALFAVSYPQYRVWPALIGILVVFIDMLWIEDLVVRWKKRAANIQELNDTKLFELPWKKFKAGSKPVDENVMEASTQYLKRKGNFKEFIDWYEKPVESLPLYLGRLVCQRINIWYDREIRLKYLIGLRVTISMGIIALIMVGLIKDMQLEGVFMSLLMPLFPTLRWFFKEIKTQKASVNLLDRMLFYVRDVWETALNGEISVSEAGEKARELQDELYIHRCTNNPILDWIYDKLKKTISQNVSDTTKHLVNEALRKINSRGT